MGASVGLPVPMGLPRTFHPLPNPQFLPGEAIPLSLSVPDRSFITSLLTRE